MNRLVLLFSLVMVTTSAWGDSVCNGNPKPQIESLLNSNSSLNLIDFNEHFKTFNYEEFITKGEFTSYVCFESSPTPWPEVILFFHKKKLIAYYGSKLESKQITSTSDLRGAKVSYFGKIGTELRTEFEGIFFPYIEQAN